MRWFLCHGHICICGQLSVTSVLPDMVCVFQMINSAQNAILLEITLKYGNFTKFPVMEILLKGTVSAEFRAVRIQIKWLVSMSNVTLGWNGLNEKWKKKKLDPDSFIVVRLRRNLLRTLYRRYFDIMFPQNEKIKITSMGFIVGVFLVDLLINIYSNKWFSAGICLLEVSNSNSRTRCKICSK